MSFEQVQPSLDERLSAFESLHDDNWAERVSVGVPLYEALVVSRDARAAVVAQSLQYLASVIENSGAGEPEERQRLLEKIQTALSAE